MSRSATLSSFRLVERSTELPDVVLKERDNWTNITITGKGFAWVNHPENRAMIKTHHDERQALLATAPTVYQAGWATSSSAWVRVRLELADPDEVFELLEEAWRMTATRRAIEAFDEAGRGSQVGRAVEVGPESANTGSSRQGRVSHRPGPVPSRGSGPKLPGR